MNTRVVFHLVSIVTLVMGFAMGLCAGLSIFWGDPAHVQHSFIYASAATMAIAGILFYLTRGNRPLSRRDGFGVVTFGWIFAAIFGALPFIFSGVIPHPVAAVFETMSGLTTTGASVLPAGNYPTLEMVPRGILFWRALTHWFGGMGVLVLCVAILPLLGVGGMQLYRAEMPGPSKDRLTPRITTTAKLLWGVYVLLTLAEALLLKYAGGMNSFDAMCHSFATIATGGFSTRTASIGAYNSAMIDWIVIVFMFAAGVNFSLHFYTLTGQPIRVLKDSEFRNYLLFWLCCGILLTVNILPLYPNFESALRAAFFSGTSVLTTTGFVTADFDRWPQSSRMLLVLMMFVGGCAGSTAGGIKVVRISIMCKKVLREIRQFMRPQAVYQLKLGRKPIEPEVISHISAFCTIFVIIVVLASYLMTFFTPDLETATTSVIATLANVGPGLSFVGPMQNFAAIPAPGQLLLTLCMLLGRLELYTVLILFLPGFWKR
ncbi:MAG: TrkH family potassium uptake protein [Kiritimatiellaceae bacterium]|nr:TrkH family potassium uptake protein [Kiritimatiellaceae bacterium]